KLQSDLDRKTEDHGRLQSISGSLVDEVDPAAGSATGEGSAWCVWLDQLLLPSGYGNSMPYPEPPIDRRGLGNFLLLLVLLAVGFFALPFLIFGRGFEV